MNRRAFLKFLLALIVTPFIRLPVYLASALQDDGQDIQFYASFPITFPMVLSDKEVQCEIH